jgi:hypothetical protein
MYTVGLESGTQCGQDITHFVTLDSAGFSVILVGFPAIGGESGHCPADCIGVQLP